MRRSLAAVLVLALAAACEESGESQLTVASRNLYLGGEFEGVIGAQSVQEAAVAMFQVWTSVQATNFPARAQLIASELAALNPDVIGLQEVSIWRTGLPLVCAPDGSGIPVINSPQASTVVYDYLQLLLDALAAKGVQYQVARSTQSFDAEFCSLNPAAPASAIDVRWTDRDVILVRQGLATANAGGGVYAFKIDYPIPGTGTPPVTVPGYRAWNVVEVEKDGRWYRVFETHLEIQEIPTPPGVPPYIFQFVQAGQLVGGEVVPRRIASPMPTVVVGDFNTQAEQQDPTNPLRATYNYLVGLIPFPDLGDPRLAQLVGTTSPLDDAWTATGGAAAAGLTWGFSPDLASGTPTQRIDLALTWDATPVSMQTFGGTDLTGGTPPLHSSDHLGIVVTVKP